MRVGRAMLQALTGAPGMNPERSLVTGTVCGTCSQDFAYALMKEIRILDKLIDELARGKAMVKVLRVG